MKLRVLTLCKVMRNELVMKTLPGGALWIYVLSHRQYSPFIYDLEEGTEGIGKKRERDMKAEREKRTNMLDVNKELSQQIVRVFY